MNVELKYFSGTGNSYKIIDTCKEMFIQNGCKTTLSSITEKSNINEEVDLKGEGSTKGKNIYYEPTFKPLKKRRGAHLKY